VAIATNNINTIFTKQSLLDFSVLLLEHFLILRQSDLEAWVEDPEEWILETTGDIVTAESGLRVHPEKCS
jgi:hypothetical protein